MGIAMEQREEADDRHADRHRDLQGDQRQQAEHHDGGRNGRLDKGRPMPASAAAKPSIMVTTKAGIAQMARPPTRKAQRPTPTIARI